MRVVIAEDSVLLREGLVRLLEDAEIDVVATAGDGTELRAAVETHQPDLAVVDVRMPPTFTDEGLGAAIEIRTKRPNFPVLILSQYVEERYASELIGSNANGVGYLLKERVADVGEFISSLRRVADGGTVIDSEVVGQLIGRKGTDPITTLSAREREVLELLAEGRSNRAIADRLVVSIGAVEKHISSIFIKLDLQPYPDDHRRVLAVLRYLQS